MKDFGLVLVGSAIIVILLEGSPQIGGVFLLLVLLAMLARAKNRPTLTAG